MPAQIAQDAIAYDASVAGHVDALLRLAHQINAERLDASTATSIR
jgi:hypothetical protein